MQYKYSLVPIADIKPNPDNPRFIRDEKFQNLVNSIKEFPEMLKLRPVVLNDEMMVLGGNMRYRAAGEAGYKDVPAVIASGLTKEQEREFIIKDNVGFGEWDWDIIANQWDTEQLKGWGMDVPINFGPDQGTDEFSLPSGDKPPFEQMTFTLASEQAEQIKNAIAIIKGTDEYKYAGTEIGMGNENSNGNALYLIIMQWAEQRK